MRKIFRHALTGFVVASFSQFALAQNVNVNPKTGDTSVSPDTSVQANPQIGSGNQSAQQSGSANQSSNTQQSGAQNQNSTQAGSGSSTQGQSQDKNPNSPGKG